MRSLSDIFVNSWVVGENGCDIAVVFDWFVTVGPFISPPWD